MVRVLLADDDAAALQLAARALTSDGHSVTTASDGQEALRLLEAQTYDILVTDLDMPGLDGFELFARAAPKMPTLKVLMVSGHADELGRARGFPSDRVATLAKPFTLPQIRAAVRSLIPG